MILLGHNLGLSPGFCPPDRLLVLIEIEYFTVRHTVINTFVLGQKAIRQKIIVTNYFLLTNHLRLLFLASGKLLKRVTAVV